MNGDLTERMDKDDDFVDRRGTRQDTPMSLADSESPASPSSPTNATKVPDLSSRFLPASLWDYLKEEIQATELDGSQELKAERVTNFFSVPMVVEQVLPAARCSRLHAEAPKQFIIFGFFVCLDSFLYTFTILPLRFCIALQRLARNRLGPGR